MQKPAHKPQRKNMFLRFRAWRQRRHSRSVSSLQIAVLPKRAALFSGGLGLSLPFDFRIMKPGRKRTADICFFRSSSSALHLTAMKLPFAKPVRFLLPIDLQIAFRHLIPPSQTPVVTHSFLRHSPTLTAEWGSAKKTVLHLIQVRKTVFLLMFDHVTADTEAQVRAIIYSASVAV